ncbi:MAG: glycosyltransferase [Selenomonadaceae bacterium]|nr:glycosyltransferase [Selenomonadaceae bacterium]MBR1858591.1 glycosyltransferase [Selenomonadaceae bacterium]
MSVTSPEVSIIIPMYNAEKYIKTTLNSIKDQTFKNYEVVIVNDFSTDNSLKVVKKFIKSESIGYKIKVVNLEENGGISNARNVGLKNACGKYVTFMDNDDMIIPKALETFVNIAEQFQAEVVHTHAHYENREPIVDNKKIVFKPTSIEFGNKKGVQAPTHELTNDMHQRLTLFSNCGIDWNVWSKLFRRDFLIKYNVQFPKIHFTEDMLFCFQTLLHSKKYIMIPDLLYIYRVRSDSTLRKDSDSVYIKKIIDVQIEGTKMLNNFMNQIDELKDDFLIKERVIGFYLTLEMSATRSMQKKYISNDNYFQFLKDIYVKYFGKDAEFVSFLHLLANQPMPNMKNISMPLDQALSNNSNNKDDVIMIN